LNSAKNWPDWTFSATVLLFSDAILLEARIIGVADVVKAMSAHRPYRPSLGIKAALEHIQKFRGSLYDAQVVDACLAVFDAGFTLNLVTAGHPENPEIADFRALSAVPH